MKKLFSAMLALCLLLSLCACTVSDTQPGTSGGNQPQTNAAPETTVPAVTFEEVVAVDNELCTIKITEIDADNLFGYTLKAYLENKTSDKTFMFSLTSAAINGVDVSALFAEEVAPGKKSNTDIIFTTDDLEANGITEYTDIAMNFRVYDSEDWTAEEAAVATVHVYPYGEAQATKFVREARADDIVLADNDNATVILTGYREDSIWGYTAELYVVNKTDKDVMVTVDEVSVNGFMADPFFATTVSAGNAAFPSISWSDSTFEENNITEVETIEFILRVYDSEDWLADDLVNETVTLNP